jgi:Na+-transporting NADH:ubiquinone oxidoreductase subunit NqrC
MSKPNNILAKFKNMPVDGMTKTLFVAITLCFVCSMVVSFAAVNLKEVQEVNKAIDKQKIFYKSLDYIMMELMLKNHFLHLNQ